MMARSESGRRWRRGAARLLMAMVPFVAVAAAQDEKTVLEGIQSGDYNVQTSTTVGWRFTGVDGNRSLYSTYVNLYGGPRLLEQMLVMRSLDHQGLLFDNLEFYATGFGGDPNNLARIRLEKFRGYDFRARFRRDRSYWDYNLLVNPLNSPADGYDIAVLQSPHLFETVHRMSDYSLTLLPQSAVSVRLGYERNVSEGPSYSSYSFNLLTTSLFQSWRNTENNYSLGFDLRLLPRTSISYDQFFNTSKGDSAWQDRNFLFQLPGGTPYDLGVVSNPANPPCNFGPDASTTPPTVQPACSGLLGYRRTAPARIFAPTEQLSFQSTALKKVEMSGRFSYTLSEGRAPLYSDLFQGFLAFANLRQLSSRGRARADRILRSGDFAATWQITPRLRINESFHYDAFHTPGAYRHSEDSQFAPSPLAPPVGFDPATCPPPFTAPACPAYTFGSGPDSLSALSTLALNQQNAGNQMSVSYDFSARFGAMLGYRYNARSVTRRESASDVFIFDPGPGVSRGCGGPPPAGPCAIPIAITYFATDVDIHQNAALFGLWARPASALRLNFDSELFWADDIFVRINPRQLQRYRLRAEWQPRHWLELSGSLLWLEQRNSASDIENRQHNRSFSFDAAVTPSPRFTLDLAYDYNDYLSSSLICYPSSQPLTATTCPLSLGLVQQTSLYDDWTHYGHFNLLWRPHPRVMAWLGYSISAVDGRALFLNPLQPPGPLKTTYQQPMGALEVKLRGGLFWKGQWLYYNYSENRLTGPAPARPFHSNVVTASLRYTLGEGRGAVERPPTAKRSEVAQAQAAAQTQAPEQPTTARGKFLANCARCHGQDATGDTYFGRRQNIPNLRTDPKRFTDAELTDFITHGKGEFMPAHGKILTPEEIQMLVGYIRELGKTP